jgi:hypothetical protein
MVEIKAPVCMVGDSGTGKSTAIEGLPTDKTLIINTEDKPLPFEEYTSFKVVNATSYKKLMQVLSQLADPEKGAKYDYVVCDSFTAIAEFIERYVDHMFSGFEQWKQYNIILTTIVNKFKALPQQVFMIALPEQKDMSFGETKSYIRVKGKELKFGWVEAQFSIVLFTEPVYDEETGEMEDVVLMYKPNKKNTAKAPRNLFKEKPKNDMMDIYNKIKAFYGKN